MIQQKSVQVDFLLTESSPVSLRVWDVRYKSVSPNEPVASMMIQVSIIPQSNEEARLLTPALLVQKAKEESTVPLEEKHFVRVLKYFGTPEVRTVTYFYNEESQKQGKIGLDSLVAEEKTGDGSIVSLWFGFSQTPNKKNAVMKIRGLASEEGEISKPQVTADQLQKWAEKYTGGSIAEEELTQGLKNYEEGTSERIRIEFKNQSQGLLE
jgi:hypothetical protein